MATMFQRATRRAVKLKIGIQGPSGSGKTDGALAMATALAQAEGGRVAVIDTENGSASLYADDYEFDTLNLDPPYTSARYTEAMRAAVDAGYAVLVIDSLSHQWAGKGGILARKEEVDARGKGNSYTNWARFTKEHEEFKAELLSLPIHVIATLRAKQDYVLVERDGKQVPKKVGLAPVQREGLEYEFSIAFELQMDHRAEASKDRSRLFDGRLVDLKDPETARQLIAWLKQATPSDVAPPSARGRPSGAAAAAPVPDAPSALTDEQKAELKRFARASWVPEGIRQKLVNEIKVGMTPEQAEKWLAHLRRNKDEWQRDA